MFSASSAFPRRMPAWTHFSLGREPQQCAMRSTARTARADYTGLRLTPFDAGLQSFPWQPNCPANHKLARDDLARRRALRRCDQAGLIEAARPPPLRLKSGYI